MIFKNLNIGEKFKNPLFLALGIVFMFLSIILFSGLYSDDRFNFYTYKFNSNFSVSLVLEEIQTSIQRWYIFGRFIPIAFILLHVVLVCFKTLFLYKAFIVVMHLFAVLAFIKMLKQFCSVQYITVWVILYTAQIKFYIASHDAFTTFHAMMAILAIFIFYSVIFYFKFLSTKKTVYLSLSLLMCFVAVLTYEVGLVSFILILCIALSKQQLRFFTTKSNYIVLFSLLMVLIAILKIRENGTMAYSGIQSNYEFSVVLDAMGNHLISTLPLNNFIEVYAVPLVLLEQFEFWHVVLISIISFVLLILFIKQFNKQSESLNLINKETLTTWIIALLLIIVPVSLISISVKYQEPFGNYNPYIQIYFQNFGLSLIFTLIIGAVYNKYKSKAFLNSMMILFFMMGFASFLLNASRVQYYNRTQSNLVDYYFKSLEMGIFNQIKNGEILYLADDFFNDPSLSKKYIDKFYNKDIQVINSNAYNENENVKIDYVYRFNRDSSKASLYKVDTILAKEVLVKSLEFPLPKISPYSPGW
jgi:hypothetical protein